MKGAYGSSMIIVRRPGVPRRFEVTDKACPECDARAGKPCLSLSSKWRPEVHKRRPGTRKNGSSGKANSKGKAAADDPGRASQTDRMPKPAQRQPRAPQALHLVTDEQMLHVACRHCRAAVGRPCTNADGSVFSAWHGCRRQLAARGR